MVGVGLCNISRGIESCYIQRWDTMCVEEAVPLLLYIFPCTGKIWEQLEYDLKFDYEIKTEKLNLSLKKLTYKKLRVVERCILCLLTKISKPLNPHIHKYIR